MTSIHTSFDELDYQIIQALLDKIGAQIAIEEKIISGVSPVIGTHTGPGTVALTYFCE